jgi:uncharacterized protein (DUF2164 family)
MAIELTPDTEQYLIGSIKRFVDEQMDLDIGDLRAALLLEFCLKEIGPSIYNKALADAQSYLQARLGDMDVACHEHEFGYWEP